MIAIETGINEKTSIFDLNDILNQCALIRGYKTHKEKSIAEFARFTEIVIYQEWKHFPESHALKVIKNSVVNIDLKRGSETFYVDLGNAFLKFCHANPKLCILE